MVTMSQKEFQRVKVIEKAAGGRLSVREASRLLQRSERQGQRQVTTKPISIKSTGGKSGGCASKAVELTSGDLPLLS
jgi:hypothetical protein